jgi:DNA-binding NarL/FixJ family response regulator
MYKILFIDEEKTTLEDFEDFVEKSPSKAKIEPITMFPMGELDEMIENIIKISPDAIISDYRLNELKTDIKYTVKYNGVDLVEEFQTIRNQFPCFVLTAVDDEAVNSSDDVNIVYVKNLLYKKDEGNAKASFLERVISQIEHYKNRIENYKNELSKLIEQRKNGNADISVESRIIELDDLLEKSIDGKSVIPPEFKTLSNSNKLDNMLSKVDQLLKKLDENGK